MPHSCGVLRVPEVVVSLTPLLKLRMHAYAYAMLAYTGDVGVGEAAYVVDLEHLEDVLDAER